MTPPGDRSGVQVLTAVLILVVSGQVLANGESLYNFLACVRFRIIPHT